ncbi:MAG: copper resistance CopC/CopD family protein [Longimicrobiales bacterium]
MPRHRIRRAVLLAGAATLVVTTAALAHTALRRSKPAEDEHLGAPPAEIVLTFTSGVDPRLARVQLLGADGGAVLLDSLRSGASDSSVVAPIAERLGGGEYTVVWQVVGTDGHPVRGQFAFLVDAPVAVTPAPAAVDPERPPVPAVVEEPASDVQAPSYVAVRWLTFATLLIAIGAVVFRAVVLEPVRRASSLPSGGAADQAATRAAVLGRGAAGFLLLAAGARLLLQLHVVDPGGEGGMLGVMVFDTVWGWGWLLQIGAALVALLAFHRAARERGGWGVAAIAVLLLAFTPGLSGHAAAAETLAPVAIGLDAVHVFAASAWLGTLLVMLVAGIPSALAQGGAGGRGMVADLVNRFSPFALVFAGVLAATGVGNALMHFGALNQLWTTSYGRTLLLKLAFVGLALGLGAFNWRRVRPTLAEAGPARLRRSAALELLAAAAILLVTALLVATPTP